MVFPPAHTRYARQHCNTSTRHSAHTVGRLAQALVNALPQQRSGFLADAAIERRVRAVLAVQMRRLQAAADEAFAHISCGPCFCLIIALRSNQSSITALPLRLLCIRACAMKA
jgi:hypothetical protein